MTQSLSVTSAPSTIKKQRNKQSDEPSANNTAGSNIAASVFTDQPPVEKKAEPVVIIDAESSDDGKEIPKIVRIRNYLDVRYEFQLDVVGNDLKWRPKRPNSTKTPFTSFNENSLIVELYERGFTNFEKQLLALLRSSYVKEYDPILAYFNGLPPWDDSKPDYIRQLAKYVSARDQTWFQMQYKKMLVRCIACGIGAIPFNKQCMVLVGKQNDGKSSFIRFHCPDELKDYYTEHVDFNNKDGKIALGENFMINLDELASFSKADVNHCKAFFTEDKTKVRRPFASRTSITKRRANFFGSTNISNFLTDETGNVRWLVMEINDIQHDRGGAAGYSRNADINLVWAQAYALFKSGFDFQLTKEEIQHSEQFNKQHMRITEEHELAMKHLEPAEPTTPDAEFLMPGEIVLRLQSRYDHRLKINSNNLGKALRALDFPLQSGRRANRIYPIQGYWVKFLH